MRVIELSGQVGEQILKEYAEVDQISNWFSYGRHNEIVEEYAVETKTWTGRVIQSKRTKTKYVVEVDGSIVVLKNGQETWVKETPEEIFQKLKNEVITISTQDGVTNAS